MPTCRTSLPGGVSAGVAVAGAGAAFAATAFGCCCCTAEDHQRRGAGGPALAHVGALGALADGVELLLVDQREEFGIALARGHFHLEPGGFAREGPRGEGVVGEDQVVER